MNPSNSEDVICPETDVSVPVLDDPISEAEVTVEIKRMASDKAPGTDGIPAGVFKHLSGQWIWLLTVLMNVIFIGVFPGSWCLAIFFTIFKKGLACTVQT